MFFKKAINTSGICFDDSTVPSFAGCFPTKAKHRRTKCSACKVSPIVGFRYKCIECRNYDLCQVCEAMHIHCEHMMIRLPHSSCPNLIEAKVTRRYKQYENDKWTQCSDCEEQQDAITDESTEPRNDDLVKESTEEENGQRISTEETSVQTLSSTQTLSLKDCSTQTIAALKDLAQFHDANFMQTSIEIMRNLNQMFAKMIEFREEIKSSRDSISNFNENNSKSEKQKTPTKETLDSKRINGKIEMETQNTAWLSKVFETKKTSQCSFAESETQLSRLSSNAVFKLQPECVQIVRSFRGCLAKVDCQPHFQTRALGFNDKVLTYHKDYRINCCVHAMMAMGFSNKGSWLTKLVASVNGDIEEALKLINAVLQKDI